MLEFNSEHKSLDGNLKAKEGFKVRDIIIGGILIATIMLFSGCTKEDSDVPCDVDNYHAHYYVNENGFDRYILGEKEYVGSLVRTDDYIVITKDIEDIISFESKEGLFRISHNKERIKEISSSQTDYLEYRYKYQYSTMNFIKAGDVQIPITTWYDAYAWTTNPNRSGLTGEQRVVHYMYYGYKVVKDENGKFKVIQSELVDKIDDLPEDYIYVKNKFSEKVNLDNKDLDINYENDPKNDPEYKPEDDPNYNQDYQVEYEKPIEQEKSKSRLVKRRKI